VIGLPQIHEQLPQGKPQEECREEQGLMVEWKQGSMVEWKQGSMVEWKQGLQVEWKGLQVELKQG
jgi:hypothetical protein